MTNLLIEKERTKQVQEKIAWQKIQYEEKEKKEKQSIKAAKEGYLLLTVFFY